MGVKEAKAKRIIQTDADCRLSRGFLREHAHAAQVDPEVFLAGPVRYSKTSEVWKCLESLEFMSLVGTSTASFLQNRPVMCNGANISYSKEFYLLNEQELNSIPSPSGDDIFLMILGKKAGLRMKYLLTENAAVTTAPSGSVIAFLQQRIRWGSKSRYYADKDMIYLAFLIFLTNLFILGVFIAGMFDPLYFIHFGTSLLIKSVSDLLLLYPLLRYLDRKELVRYYPLAALFYYFYLVLTGILALFSSYRWKGRKFKTAAH